jgi:hypothetical protein
VTPFEAIRLDRERLADGTCQRGANVHADPPTEEGAGT